MKTEFSKVISTNEFRVTQDKAGELDKGYILTDRDVHVDKKKVAWKRQCDYMGCNC